MHAIASTPGALRLAAVSVVARVPMAMLSLGLLVHVRHLTGSFAAAGVVAGAFAVALGVGGPLQGGLVDRRGQTRVLLAGALVYSALAVIAALKYLAVRPPGLESTELISILKPLAGLEALSGPRTIAKGTPKTH